MKEIIGTLLVISALALASTSSCKKGDEPTCAPEDQQLSIQIIGQATEQLNPDAQGQPLTAKLRIYETNRDPDLDSVEFEQFWSDAETELGDSLIGVHEVNIAPGGDFVERVVIDPETRFMLVVAGMRKTSSAWFSVYEIPIQHRETICASLLAEQEAKRSKNQPVPEPPADPCLHVFLDGHVLDAGGAPPPGFDQERRTARCALPYANASATPR